MPQPAPIDGQALEDLRRLGGEELVQQLLASFLRNAPRRVAEAEAGLQAGELEQVERAVHTLKSSSRYLGAQPLSALCFQAEEAARAGRAGELPRLVQQVSEELARAMEVLQRLQQGT